MWASPDTFVGEGKILNYVNPKLVIRETPLGNGRGIFTNEFIEEGELLIVERAITSCTYDVDQPIEGWAEITQNL